MAWDIKLSFPSSFRNSLYARSLAFIATTVVLGALILCGAAFYYARVAANEAYDRLLVFGVVQVAENLFVQGGVVALDPPAAAFASLSAYDLVFYKIVDPRGVVVAGHPDLGDDAPLAQAKNGPVLSTGQYQGQEIRIATLGRHLSNAPADGWVIVTLAQTRLARDAFARELATKAILIVLAMSLLTLLAGGLAIRFALAPLARVENAIAVRDPNNLSALDLDIPVEIRALVSAINLLMERLRQRMTVMQRFIADCAHQIRTPLAALDAQAELLSNEPEGERVAQRVLRIRQRSTELARLTNQLLSHAMVTHRAKAEALVPIDLVALVRAVLADAVPLSLDREVSVNFNATQDIVMIEGDAMSLREALSNLIHNALTHGALSSLSVKIVADAEDVSVEVIDDGVGIPCTEWERVCEPFVSGSAASNGSGLGLAIASEVLKAHGGRLDFRERSEQNFAVILKFRQSK